MVRSGVHPSLHPNCYHQVVFAKLYFIILNVLSNGIPHETLTSNDKDLHGLTLGLNLLQDKKSLTKTIRATLSVTKQQH